jgi:hypothetical protein
VGVTSGALEFLSPSPVFESLILAIQDAGIIGRFGYHTLWSWMAWKIKRA